MKRLSSLWLRIVFQNSLCGLIPIFYISGFLQQISGGFLISIYRDPRMMKVNLQQKRFQLRIVLNSI